ncbi:acylphosphatase [Rugamonas rivuli]|uniref:acylphosphatase n=1 Tax=Rugamonas rivuli TaxID=2743358 RepID=A0A843SDD9_9BURK|nr:acylphosphatase [Rugamonas rivuli]MQA20213.1 acylphosphatase [Rugamonas rivuli]
MIRLMVEGRVQGVGYRASFAERARALGLSGWVRNRRDGSVEAAVDGEPQAIEAITTWARHGPPAARVSNVTIEDGPALEPVGGDFKILPTL